MLKNSSRRQKGISPLIYLLLALSVLIAVMFMIFAQHNVQYDTDLDDVSTKIVVSQVQQYAERIRGLLNSVNETRKNIASIMENDSSVSYEVLTKSAVDTTGAHKAVICDEEGKGIDQYGKAVDLSDIDYFNKIKNVEDYSGSFCVKSDKLMGGNTFVSAQAVKTASGTRYLLLYYPSDNINNYLSTVSCGEDTYFLVIDNDGGILISSGDTSNKVGDNLWSALDKTNGVKETYRLQKHFSRNIAGSDEYIESEGVNKILVYCPLKVEDRYFVASVGKDYIAQQTAALRKDGSSLCNSITVLVILFSGIVIMLSAFTLINTDKSSTKLQEKADSDLLTSLNNKLATERKIKEYMEDNKKEQCIMLLLDIDNFKKINDTLGHAFGDEVLRTLGNHIGSVFRVSDIIGRTGGDEFTIFLKNLGNDDVICMEALKAAEFFENFQAGGYVKYSVTASIGVAVYPREGENFEELYKSADVALYKAKNRGKNQIAFHDDELGKKYNELLKNRIPSEVKVTQI